MKKNLNILSINGGGIRGLIALKQLVELERICQMPLNKKFQLISGTSTGGIIAVMLSIGKPAKELLEIYTKHGDNIFKKRFLRFGVFTAKYDSTYFEELIYKFVGDMRLSDVAVDITIPAYNITREEMVLFKSKKAREDSRHDFYLRDVIRATASAPSFFKAHKIDGDYYIDGGMIINNPAQITFTEARKANKTLLSPKKINCIAFSTGTLKSKFTDETASAGMLGWASPSVNLLLKNQDQVTHYFLNEMFTEEPGVYLRCDSYVDKSDGSIDNANKKNIEAMLIDGDTSSWRNRTAMVKFHLDTL